MKTIDVMGKPCPIPVIEAKKALAEPETEGVLVKVDNITAVQNLEKMANGYGYRFSFEEKAKDAYEVAINRDGKKPPEAGAEIEAEAAAGVAAGAGAAAVSGELGMLPCDTGSAGLAVAIGRDAMGDGSEELGKILIKGFIYALSELPVPPKYVIFFNSGAHLTSEGSNTVDDLKKLEGKGTEILTCGTCVNYYGLKDKLAVGAITDMYGITERLASAAKIMNI